MAIDDATNLVSELLDKLSELEQKVETHRQDMASEFQRYSRHLLQDVNGDVSARVETLIKNAMHKYPALTPALDLDNPIRNESPTSPMDHADGSPASKHDARSKCGKRSPPPLLPHTSGTPPDAQDVARSPHEREREFQGLFTPSYLPLLDSRDNRNNKPPPALTLPPALPSSSDNSTKLTRDPAKDEQPLSPPVITLRPGPVRRPTEDTISSANSDDSTGKQRRRSALRRSSSSSVPQSPRRVRFEVEGGEVLPTASPPLSPRVVEHTLSPLSNNTNLLNDPYDSLSPEPEEEGEVVSLLGSSPPSLPKKVSSTDRLKAMARSSQEDTSKWNMVGDLHDMDEDEEILVMGARKKSTSIPRETAQSNYRDSPTMPENPSGSIEHVEDVQPSKEETESYEDEADDLFEMPALSSFKTRKRFSPPQSEPAPAITQATTHNSATPTKSILKTAQPPQSEPPTSTSFDEDAFFEWDPDEDEDGSKTSKVGQSTNPPPKYLEDMDDEEEDDDEDDGSTARNTNHNSGATSTFSTSPGVSITRPTTNPGSLPSRHATEAVGSYNGRPFTISSVKDQSILEKAAKMGDMYSFVGSVDGRSGVDESTSFRPDASTFSGTPRSLSQRLAMEEYAQGRHQSPMNGR